MKCKKCKREIAENSIFCNWCGYKQLTQSTEVRVPVPKRKGDTWSAQVMVDGERVYVSASSEEEYYTKARATKSGLLETKKTAPKITLGTVIDNYIRNNNAVLSPSTIRGYTTYRNTRFANYIKKSAYEIDYQKMVNEELAYVKPKTVINAYRLVTAALRAMDFEPPSVNLPKVPRSERPWLDYEQIAVFLKAVHGKPCELGALLALHGLRRSEILHLSADDIKNERIFVHGSSVLGTSNKIIDKDTNKNITSTRIVSVVIPRLNELIKGKNGRLVTGNPNNLWRDINRVCKSAGLPQVGVHGLRHSYISLCFHLGWDMQTVMYQGGYSNMQTVNDVYRHLAQQDANDDINRMKEFYEKGVRA